MKQERLIHLDLLRILACYSVIMLHSAAQYWYSLPVTSMDWLIVNSYNALVRFGVPIFVMISGALFLSSEKEIDIKRLYTHNILRLAVIYYIWSAAYGLFDCRGGDWSALSVNSILVEIYAGRYHLWYLPMTIGLYMLIPILKKSLRNLEKKDVQYFLFLFIVIRIGGDSILAIKPAEWLGFLNGVVEFGGLLDYLGYFILGYYLVRYGIDVKWHKWIYMGGIFGSLANVFLSNYITRKQGVASEVIYDSFGFFTFLVVLALFLFFNAKGSKWQLSAKKCRVIKELSLATLGTYLMHLMILEYLQEKGIHSMMVTPIIGVPFVALICFVLCLLCAALLRRIPVIGKYIC